MNNINSWSWHGPVRVDSNLAVQSESGRLSVDVNGNAWVTFYEYVSSNDTANIWVNTRPVGGALQTATRLPQVAGWPQLTYPDIAATASGAVVAFQARGSAIGSARSVRAAWLNPDHSVVGGVQRVDSVSSDTPQLSQRRSLATDAAGNAILAWGENQGFYAVSAAPGGTFSSPITINSASNFQWSMVNVAAGAAGKAYVGWHNDSTAAVTPLFPNGNILTMGAPLTTQTGVSIVAPVVAAKGQTAMTAWRSTFGHDWRLFSGGSWSPNNTITTGGDGWNFNHTLAMNNTGQAVLLWREYPQNGADSWVGQVWASFFDGFNWSTPQRLSAPGTNRKAWWAHVDINDVGAAVASWADFDPSGTYTRIWASVLRYDGGAPAWQAPVTIDADSPNATLAERPENVRNIWVGLNPGGTTAYVTWKETDPSGTPRTWLNWLE